MRPFRRYVVDVQYAGSRFSGWISTPTDLGDHSNPPGVVEVLKKAFAKFVGEDNYKNLKGSSRTDAGVSALLNRFHVDIYRPPRPIKTGANEDVLPRPPYDNESIVRALNFYADNSGLRVLRARMVCPTFSVTNRATARSYIYRIAFLPSSACRRDPEKIHPWVLDHHGLWVVNSGLDVDQMQAAAQLFIGEKDFSSVRNAGCQALTPVRTIFSLVIKDLSIGPHNDEIYKAMVLDPFRLMTIRIAANAFLYRMVRNIVSILVKVGQGKLTVEDVKIMLDKRNRSCSPGPAPAHALFLEHVYFQEEKDWDDFTAEQWWQHQLHCSENNTTQ